MVPADNGIEVVVMRRLADGEAARAAIAVLSADERERAQRFILRRHRLQFVERRAALRRLLGERLGIAAARVRLSTAIDGKPSLAAPLDRSGVTFNQSHCGDLSVYAFASRTDVGIDVEAIRVIEDADHVASIAFSKREYETYERLPPSDKPIGFLNCWTRKEAFVKAVGSGLSHSLDGFDVSLMPNEPPRLLRLGSIDGSSGWQLHSFFPVSGFIAALAARATA
jgi:4'-phosphopantetheinyl transferase